MPGLEIYDISLGKFNRAFGFNMDPAGVLQANAQYVWDANALAWVMMTQPGATPPGSAAGTVAIDGANSSTLPVSGTFSVQSSTTPVTGTFWQDLQPITVPGQVSVTGTFWQTVQPISGTVALLGTALITGAVSLSATANVAGTFWQATQPVSGTVQLSGSSATLPVSGTVSLGTTALISGAITTISATGTINTTGSISTISATGTVNTGITTVTGTGTLNTGITTITGTGTLNVGISTIAPAGTAKGTQGGTFLPVQNAKDSGRAMRVFTINYTTAPGTEGVATFTVNQGLNVTTSVSVYTVTSGKTLRLQAISAAALNSTTTQSNAKLRVRTSTAASIASPVCIDLAFPAIAGTTVAALGTPSNMAIPDGLEIAAGQSIAISTLSSPTSSALVGCSLIGYEY